MSGLSHVGAFAWKENRGYFTSTIAYVVTFGFLFAMGLLFSVIVTSSNDASLRGTFGNMGIVVLILAPALTMRLLSEEAHSGTIELLMTSPVRDWEIVVGKFLGSLVFYTFMLLLTGWYPALLLYFGNPDRGPMIAGYLGMYLMGLAMLAIGELTSSWTENQIVAYVVGFGVLLILYLINAAGTLVGPPLSGLFTYLGMADHLNDFLQGTIDTHHVIYYLSIVVASLFLATRSLESRRYR